MALTKVTGQVIKNTTDVTVGVLTVTNTLAVGGTVSIGGTLTYEDVTNVDAVGLITARNGIVVGSGITLSKDGDGFFTGIVTAASYVLANGEEVENCENTLHYEVHVVKLRRRHCFSFAVTFTFPDTKPAIDIPWMMSLS